MEGHVCISSFSSLIEARGLSSRSIRRYCKERNINVSALRWVSEECLEEMVVRNMQQVFENICRHVQVLSLLSGRPFVWCID